MRSIRRPSPFDFLFSDTWKCSRTSTEPPCGFWASFPPSLQVPQHRTATRWMQQTRSVSFSSDAMLQIQESRQNLTNEAKVGLQPNAESQPMQRMMSSAPNAPSALFYTSYSHSRRELWWRIVVYSHYEAVCGQFVSMCSCEHTRAHRTP